MLNVKPSLSSISYLYNQLKLIWFIKRNQIYINEEVYNYNNYRANLNGVIMHLDQNITNNLSQELILCDIYKKWFSCALVKNISIIYNCWSTKIYYICKYQPFNWITHGFRPGYIRGFHLNFCIKMYDNSNHENDWWNDCLCVWKYAQSNFLKIILVEIIVQLRRIWYIYYFRYI